MEEEKKQLQKLKPRERSDDQKKRLKTVQNVISVLKKKLPSQLSAVKKRTVDMSEEERRVDAAARKKTSRASQSREKSDQERAADRVRKASQNIPHRVGYYVLPED